MSALSVYYISLNILRIHHEYDICRVEEIIDVRQNCIYNNNTGSWL
jgi:hypothetical protein